MTDDTQELRKLVEKAIQRAYYLGQEYWRLADSESWSDNRRSFDIQDKFDALRSETVSVAGAGVAALLEEIDALRAELQARQWQPIETAPKDGTEILAWRHDCGQLIASYTSPSAFPLTQAELDEIDEATLFADDWFTQWPQAMRLDGSEAPTHWMPLPPAPPQGD